MLRNVSHRRGGGAGVWLLIGLLLGGAVGAATMFVLKRDIKSGIPGGPRLGAAQELELVPADAVGFVHLRARDIWQSDTLADFRKIVEQAGPEQLALLDSAFVPKPSTFDRVTLIVMAGTKATSPLPPPRPSQPAKPPTPPSPPKIAPKAPGQSSSPVAPKIKSQLETIKPESQVRKPLIEFPDHVELVGLFAFTEPLDAGQVRAAILPDAVDKKILERVFWVDEKRNLGVYFPEDVKTVMAIGSVSGVTQLLSHQPESGKPKQKGPLTTAIDWAMRGGRHWVAAVNGEDVRMNPVSMSQIIDSAPFTTGEYLQLAADSESLFRAEAYALGGTIGMDEAKLEARAFFKDEKQADEAEKAIRNLAAFAKRKLVEPKRELEQVLKGKPGEKSPRTIEELPQAIGSLLGIGFMNHIEQYLTDPPLKRSGKEIAAIFDLPSVGETYFTTVAASTAFLLPAVAKVRDAAGRMSSSNNLKQIALGMMNYESAYNAFPQSAPANAKDKNQLSWRVQILPFVEENNLYKEFKLDEPWNSPNNIKLIGKMPKIYQSPVSPAVAGQTYYKVFSGKDAMFGPGKKTQIKEILDGPSNTILAVEGGTPVIWTKPEDIEFDPDHKLPNLSLAGKRTINIAMVDGSVRNIDLDKVSEKMLKAAITINHGEILGPDWDK